MLFKTKIGEENLEVEIGELATQASGSALVKLGQTTVLATCQKGEIREGIDFLSLTCNYEERFYAAGKILGSRFIRRESRPSTEAILISRVIDRGIRPLFPDGFKNEVQIISTCLSWDKKNDPGLVAALGTSMALSVSEIPWNGPLATIRIGKIGEEFILNPDYLQREEGELDLFISVVNGKNGLLANMIELEGEEILEETLLEAFDFAQPTLQNLIDFQKEIREKTGKEKIYPSYLELEKDEKLEKKARKLLEGQLKEILFQGDKQKREKELKELKEKFLEEFSREKEEKKGFLKDVFEKEKTRIFEKTLLEKNERPDKRKLDEIREIDVKVNVLPRTHGSAIFTRGETKVLSILTLGAPEDQQLLQGMEIQGKKRFLHHYNFPPYSTGEVAPLRSPGRREIGHGMLAEKALFPLIPKFEDFPYTIRVVSEIVASNGSTSMASVSAASLALMDGGVPIKRPAAGIAIGLVTIDEEFSNYKILTDIQGPEDSSGNMDFKVAGTEKGITAIQLDVKIKGLTKKIIKEILERAKKARLEILEKQSKVLGQPRKELSVFAPRVYTLNINPEKIGAVIGPGGRIINEIIENCEVSIDIEKSGMVFITSDKDSAIEKAVDWIKNLTREAKVGEIFQAKVKKILDFGAVVEIFPGQEGLVHISRFADFHIPSLQNLIKISDIIPVKVIDIDESGKIILSAKEAGYKPNPIKRGY